MDLKSIIADALKSYKDIPDAENKSRCVVEPMGCGRAIAPEEFDRWDKLDKLTRKEYAISGLCDNCQGKIFVDLEECTCDNSCCEVDIGVGIITCGSQHCPIHGSSRKE